MFLWLQMECDPKVCVQMTATEQWIFLCAAHKNPKEVLILFPLATKLSIVLMWQQKPFLHPIYAYHVFTAVGCDNNNL